MDYIWIETDNRNWYKIMAKIENIVKIMNYFTVKLSVEVHKYDIFTTQSGGDQRTDHGLLSS